MMTLDVLVDGYTRHFLPCHLKFEGSKSSAILVRVGVRDGGPVRALAGEGEPGELWRALDARYFGITRARRV